MMGALPALSEFVAAGLSDVGTEVGPGDSASQGGFVNKVPMPTFRTLVPRETRCTKNMKGVPKGEMHDLVQQTVMNILDPELCCGRHRVRQLYESLDFSKR